MIWPADKDQHDDQLQNDLQCVKFDTTLRLAGNLHQFFNNFWVRKVKEKLMSGVLTATVILVNFTAYPQFVQPNATVEAWTDKGLIVELIIKCPSGPPSAILTFSKAERLYCLPDQACFAEGRVAIKQLCQTR